LSITESEEDIRERLRRYDSEFRALLERMHTCQRRPFQLAYRVSDALHVSGLGKTKFYEEIAAGKILARKVGRRTLIDAESLLDYLKSQPRLGNPKRNSSGQASQAVEKTELTAEAPSAPKAGEAGESWLP
jgi:hypothetical protein